MDFTFTEDQIAIRDLARGILEKEATQERVKQVAREPEWCDARLWATLAEAGLLGLAIPPAHGGMGLGLLELCILLEEIGRVVAPLPAWPTLVLGALPIAALGTDAQRARWLPAVAGGETILTAALAEHDVPDAPVSARRDGASWVLDGRKRWVPAVGLAARILVAARREAGGALFLVDPKAGGVTLERRAASTGEPAFTIELAGVRVPAEDVLGGDADGAAAHAAWLADRALAAVCATQVGVSERALEITARYVRERVQFGVPIGSFQAVQHRLADAYIDLAAMRWVTWRAAWRLASDIPASRETAIAKFWAADGGARIANTAQHLHGGIGVDMDYPVHRYFLWTKALELRLGAATPQLVRLGSDLARTPPAAGA
jgi:alkylation response protein AidB-like acyl-CoA dehydrogenase